jgi:hypothetical protein
VLLIAGCSQPVIIKRGTDQPSGSYQSNSYTIVSSDVISNGKNYRHSDIRFKLVSGSGEGLRDQKVGEKVRRILAAGGFIESPDPDLLIVYRYNHGGTSEIEHSIPYDIRGITGVQSANTYGQIFNGNLSATTTYQPSYGVVGRGEYKYATNLYFYNMSLTAYDMKSIDRGNKNEVFDAKMHSGSQFSDFDLNVIAMLLAIKEQIGVGMDFPSGTRTIFKNELINPSSDYYRLDIDVAKNKADEFIKSIQTKSKSGKEGQACENQNGCASALICNAQHICSDPFKGKASYTPSSRHEGDSCTGLRDCAGDLSCSGGTCKYMTK